MNNSYKINNLEYINIDEIYYGGSDEILFLENSLNDFTKYFSSGSMALTDVLIYELNKYSDVIGTMGKYSLTREEYANTLRNYIYSTAYRQFGFLSIKAVERYVERFSAKRRIKIETELRAEFSSQTQFENFIINALEENHPIILQMGVKSRGDILSNFNVIVAYENSIITFASNGKKVEMPISRVFNYGDSELGALYLEVIL